MHDWPPPESENSAYYQEDLGKAPDFDPTETFLNGDGTNIGSAAQSFDPHHHADPTSYHPLHADSFGSSITTQTNSSSSSDQHTYSNVESPSAGLSILGQQFMNPVYSLGDNYTSKFIQGHPTFMPAGTHDLHAWQSSHNSGINQEWNQSYFSANVHQSPSAIDPGHVSGDTMMPSHQSVPIVRHLSLGSTFAPEVTTQGSSNVLPRQSNELPLPKNVLGYVDPKAAWYRLCNTEPTLRTEDMDGLFFPPDQAALRNAKGEFICQVQAKVTYEGRAAWTYTSEPCNAVLKCGDSYRRHLVLSHLGCNRGDKNKLITWIAKRWYEAGTLDF